jgi:predicted SPOUT superfamily RNA methylase MTH1
MKSDLGLHGLTESTRINWKKIKKICEILIFHMKKLRNNLCDFLSHIEKILCYLFKLKYLKKKSFLSHIEKT